MGQPNNENKVAKVAAIIAERKEYIILAIGYLYYHDVLSYHKEKLTESAIVTHVHP